MATDAATLARAKRRRERDLQRTTELLTACTCEYPLTTFRNRSGHDAKCPAHAIFLRHLAEDDELRSLLP